jgi:hypothetical protein
LATGHFSGKFFSKIAGSGPDGSNDTILKFVSRPGAEAIECQTHTHTNTHTEYGYYNIDTFKLFCLFGCLYQISKITKIYISYETTTEVKYETESIISLPAITFCTFKGFFIDNKIGWNYLSNGTFTSTEAENLLNKLKIKDQFKTLFSS